jgi:hypothetical protein
MAKFFHITRLVKNLYCGNDKKINSQWPAAKSQMPDSG